MSVVRHDSRVCGNGPREYTGRMGMEPWRSGVVCRRVAQWRRRRGVSDMVLAKKSRVWEQERPAPPMSSVNEKAEVLKRGKGSFSAIRLFPVPGPAFGEKMMLRLCWMKFLSNFSFPKFIWPSLTTKNTPSPDEVRAQGGNWKEWRVVFRERTTCFSI